MKRDARYFILSLLISGALHAELIDLCGTTSTTVMDGEYNLMNNIWGSGSGVGDQCLQYDPNGSYFKVSVSTHDNGSSVAAYPAIFKGCHWGWCTTKDNPMPIRVNEIESAPLTWIVTTDEVPGTWNAALDLWFNDTPTGTDYDAELMVWIDYHGGAAHGGSKRAAVEIGGHTWDVFFATWDWNYIAYKITSPIDTLDVDLRDFIHDSITRGYINTPWYLHTVEAGFEIFSGGQGLTSESFATDVFEGSTPVNYAPLPFTLSAPRDKNTVDSLMISFSWQETTDPDLDPVEYLFHLSGVDLDTTITGLTDYSLVFDGRQSLAWGSAYTWYVEATDGVDTTASKVSRTFKTPASFVADDPNQAPIRFSLSQNYPNPFNPVTEILFEMHEAGDVDLSVYNLLGEKVRTLKNGFIRSGSYRVLFDASGLSSGVYTVRLQTGFHCLNRKCLYIR
jgi:hypothetical protein